MPDLNSRLQRYLRVAYSGADEAARPTRRHWAIRASVAIPVAVGVLAVGIIVVAALWLGGRAAPLAAPGVAPPVSAVPGSTAPAEAAPPGTGPSGPPPGTGPSSPSSGSTMVVHVAGAVAQPGVIEMPPGSRVVDAIEAAGGATPEAALDALNLAAPVTDGQQVFVPIEGEAPPPGAQAVTGGPGGGPVNLNTADAATLDTLPGIGPALAERIIAWRNQHGPFSDVDSLTAVSGIGPATVAELRDLATV